MGYNNESASPNKYSGMKEYCEKMVTKKLSKVMNSAQNKEDEIKALKPTFEYRPPLTETLTPVAAIDGGIAVLFPNEVSETKLLKVAVGIPPSWSGYLNMENMEGYTHVFTGQLRWPDGTEQSFNEIVSELIDIVLENEIIAKAREVLQISKEDFVKALHDRANHLKSKSQDTLTGFEDNLRELLEVSAMVVFTDAQKNNAKLLAHFQKYSLGIPYLLIKDGTLYPSRMTVSGMIADKVADYFSQGDVPVIGVIKSSRFVNKDNIWAKVIMEYAQGVKSHTFFRIPKKIELSIDSASDKIPYKRYFLSLFGGQSIYEIQIPEVLTQDDKKLKFLLQVLAEQITYKYGGSISTNSFAHERASLPEVEARHLTENLRQDLKYLIKKQKEDKKKQDKE